MEGQAHAHCFLGRASGVLGISGDVDTHLRQSLELFQQLGDRVGQATVHRAFTLEFDRQNQPRLALHHAQRFLELVRLTGDRASQAIGVNAVGWCYARLGDHAQALHWCHQALQLSQELGYRSSQARTWCSLGYAYRHVGLLNESAHCYRHAVNLYQQLDDQYEQAETLDHLGDTLADAGDPVAAQSSWHEALYIHYRRHLYRLGRDPRQAALPRHNH
jgi:tetratricopeptide (TPR) repeat protein